MVDISWKNNNTLIKMKESECVLHIKEQNLSPKDAVDHIQESLKLNEEDAYTFWESNIYKSEMTEEEIKEGFQKMAAQIPVAGYTDEDGATVAPASWRD